MNTWRENCTKCFRILEVSHEARTEGIHFDLKPPAMSIVPGGSDWVVWQSRLGGAIRLMCTQCAADLLRDGEPNVLFHP